VKRAPREVRGTRAAIGPFATRRSDDTLRDATTRGEDTMKTFSALKALGAAALVSMAVACGGTPDAAPVSDDLSMTREAETATFTRGDLSVIVSKEGDGVALDYVDHGNWIARMSVDPSGNYMMQTSTITRAVKLDQDTMAGLASGDPAAAAKFERALGITASERAKLAGVREINTAVFGDADALKRAANGDVQYLSWGGWACIVGVVVLAGAAAVATGGAGAAVILSGEAIGEAVCGIAAT
jgi:hypothetical protein